MFKRLKEKAKHLLAAVLSLTTVGSGVAAATATVANAADEGDWYLTIGSDSVMIWWKDTSGYFTGLPHKQMYMHNKQTGETVEVFCIQKKTIIGTEGNRGYNANGELEAWESLSESAQNKIALASLWYHVYHDKDINYSTATQYYIWSLTSPEQYGGSINWEGIRENHANGTGGANINTYNTIKSIYDELSTYVEQHSMNAKPNFQLKAGQNFSKDGDSYVLNPGDTIVFEDTNHLFHLEEWSWDGTDLASRGLTVQKQGDELHVTLSPDYAGNSTFDISIQRFKSWLANDNRVLIFGATGRNENGQLGQATIYGHGFTIDPSFELGVKGVSGKIRVEKRDSISRESLSGTTFEIHKDTADGELKGTMRTGHDGTAESEYLPYGHYVVVETGVPTGYNKGIVQSGNWTGTVKEVDINKEAGETVTVEFYDKPIQGTVKIRKVDDAHPEQGLAGVEFEIHQTSDRFGNTFDTVVGKLTTDENGEATSGPLYYGNYYLQETQAKYGYFNNQKKYEFAIEEEGQQEKMTLMNTQTKLDITVYKEDSNTDGYFKEGESKRLAGAQFELWEHVVVEDSIGNTLHELDTQIVDAGIATSDSNGEAHFDVQLAFSEELQQNGSYYYVKEVKAPVGYYLNEETFPVQFDYPGQFQAVVKQTPLVKNDFMTGRLTVKKVAKDTEEPLAGAKYRILNDKNDVVDEITTGPDGLATSKELRFGTYTIHEIQAPENYKQDAAPITVELKPVEQEDGSYEIVQQSEVVFKNSPKTGHLVVTKVDSATLEYKLVCEDEEDLETCEEVRNVTDDTLKLAGAKFSIYKQGDLKTAVATATSDAQGKIEIDLKPGKYYIQEDVAPTGYNVNPELVPFEIVADEETPLLIGNQVIYGQMEVYKIGEELVGTEKTEDGVTELQWEDRYQPNTKFELTADDTITNPANGDTLYEKDDVVRTVVTDGEGKAEIKELPLGKYCLTEVTAPEEHSLGDEYQQCFEIKESEANFEGVVEKTATFTNERIIIDPTLYKQGADLKDIKDENSGYTYRSLAGAKFGIYNEEKIVSNDGTVEVEPDTLLATMVTKEDGTADVEVKLPFGKYYVQEIEAPSGYIIDKEKHPFELVWSEELQELKIMNVKISDEENPIINYQHPMPDTSVTINTALIAGVATIAVTGLVVVIARKRKEKLAD